MGYEFPIFLTQSLLTHQLLDQLAENDDFLKTAFSNFKRPSLEYVTGKIVTVEENTGVANRSRVSFSDGEVRLADGVDIGNLRGCDLTKTAEFTTGIPQAGIHTSYTLTNNRWYYIYAVKITIAGQTDNFILAADEVAPDSDAGIVALITNYGQDGWAYLGMIRYGDSDSVPDEILDFKMSGGLTMFRNVVTGDTGFPRPGILLASDDNGGTQFLTYVYAPGTGDLQIPPMISVGIYTTGCDDGNTEFFIQDEVSGSWFMYRGRLGVKMVEMPIALGIKIDADNGVGDTRDIIFGGFYDRFFAPDHNKYLGRL